MIIKIINDFLNYIIKMKKHLSYLVFFLILISCKDNKISKNQENNRPFEIIIDLIIIKNDNAILYYRDGSNEWFDEKHSVWVGLAGSKKAQKLKFSLPKGVLPNHLRLDFSNNPKQEPLRLLNIKIKYQNRVFEIKEEEVLNYFNLNECIIFDKAKKTYNPIKDSNGIYDPYLLINEKFYIKMDDIIMGN